MAERGVYKETVGKKGEREGGKAVCVVISVGAIFGCDLLAGSSRRDVDESERAL